MIDQQDGDGWIVPATVTATLLDDPACAAAAYEATAALCGEHAQPPWPVWVNAARFGLTDPILHIIAQACFATDPVACRATFRNWDLAVRRQIFAGFRTARTADDG